MSHFTCLVLGEDPEALLEPFREVWSAETDNAEGKWDWWVVGGRWANTLVTRSGEAVDQCRIGELSLEAIRPPFAILDGSEWHERGEMGWFATVSDEKSEEEWAAEAGRLLASANPSTLVTLCDLHI